MCSCGDSSGAARSDGSVAKPPPDRGLARCQRITESGHFREAFASSPRFAGRFMVLIPCGGEGRGRLGVVVSRRSFRRAVDRNRAKRLLREAFRLNRGRFGKDAPDVVLLARPSILVCSFRRIEEDLMALAGKAKMRRGT